MVIKCILRISQSKIKTLILVDLGASAYSFIDQDSTQFHKIFFHLIKYFRIFRDFDEQLA